MKIKRTGKVTVDQMAKAEADVHVLSHLLKQRAALNIEITALERQRDEIRAELAPLLEAHTAMKKAVEQAKGQHLDATVITRHTLKEAIAEILREQRGLCDE